MHPSIYIFKVINQKQFRTCNDVFYYVWVLEIISSISPYTGKNVLFSILEFAKLITGYSRENYPQNMLNQGANSSAALQEHEDEHGRQTAPHLCLRSLPCDNPSLGPDRQHISCQQSLNVQEAGKEEKVS